MLGAVLGFTIAFGPLPADKGFLSQTPPAVCVDATPEVVSATAARFGILVGSCADVIEQGLCTHDRARAGCCASCTPMLNGDSCRSRHSSCGDKAHRGVPEDRNSGPPYCCSGLACYYDEWECTDSGDCGTCIAITPSPPPSPPPEGQDYQFEGQDYQFVVGFLKSTDQYQNEPVLNWFFQASSITLMNEQTAYGVGMDGSFGSWHVEDGTKAGGSYLDGLNTKNALEKCPLTFPIGHPYYDESTTPQAIAAAEAFGSFTKSGATSWQTHVEKQATPVDVSQEENAAQGVLLVEKPADSETQKALCLKVPPSGELSLLGIVVRHGGVLLFEDKDLLLRVGFVIVESGGLLQAGSHFGDAYRFTSNLRIVLDHQLYGAGAFDAVNGYSDSNGYANAPVPASEYGSAVYGPGIGDDAKDAYSTAGLKLDGLMDQHNAFGAKSIGVGFNGNLQLNGAVPKAASYTSTWEAWKSDGSQDSVRWAEQTMKPLTIGVSEEMWPSSYPLTWARLSRASASSAGGNLVYVDMRDLKLQGVGGTAWRKGDRIILTAATEMFSSWNRAESVGAPCPR